MEGLPASCSPQCGLCGDTLVVMGASVFMQISVCLPSVCVCHVQPSARVCFLYIQPCTVSGAKRPGLHRHRNNTHIKSGN